MHGSTPDSTSDDFRNRLNRIRQGREGVIPPEQVAAYDSATMPRRVVARNVSPLPDWRENIRYPGKIVGAFFLGLAAVVISRWIRFNVSGGAVESEYSDLSMMLDAGMAFAIGFGLRMLFSVEGKEFIVAKTVGIFVMVATMHNLVHTAPAPFASAFSPEWVEAVVATTEPATIVFQGMTFALRSGVESGSTTHADMGGSALPARLILDSER